MIRVIQGFIVSAMVVFCWLFCMYILLIIIEAIIDKPIVNNLFDKKAWKSHYIVNSIISLFCVIFSLFVFCKAFTYVFDGMPMDDEDIKMIERDRAQEYREPVL